MQNSTFYFFITFSVEATFELNDYVITNILVNFVLTLIILLDARESLVETCARTRARACT